MKKKIVAAFVSSIEQRMDAAAAVTSKSKRKDSVKPGKTITTKDLKKVSYSDAVINGRRMISHNG